MKKIDQEQDHVIIAIQDIVIHELSTLRVGLVSHHGVPVLSLPLTYSCSYE